MTQQTGTPPATKEGLQTEAKELEADIKETEQEVKEERQAGNDERADRLETSLDETKRELADIKATLKQLVDRPFAPAPGDGEQGEQGKTEQGEQGEQGKTEQDETPAAAERRTKRRHFLFGDRWNEE